MSSLHFGLSKLCCSREQLIHLAAFVSYSDFGSRVRRRSFTPGLVIDPQISTVLSSYRWPPPPIFNPVPRVVSDVIDRTYPVSCLVFSGIVAGDLSFGCETCLCYDSVSLETRAGCCSLKKQDRGVDLDYDEMKSRYGFKLAGLCTCNHCGITRAKHPPPFANYPASQLSHRLLSHTPSTASQASRPKPPLPASPPPRHSQPNIHPLGQYR